jgi:hypothetical protein
MALVLIGCAHRPHRIAPPEETTAKARTEVIARLNEAANDPARTTGERALAVFSLFRGFVKPGSLARDIREIVTDPRWLDHTRIYGVYVLAGWVPVNFDFEDTAFSLHLFPEGEKPVAWCVYITLSGAAQRPEKSAMEILRGQRQWDTNTRLVEFALCHPGGLIEHVTMQGVHSSYPFGRRAAGK